MAKRYFEFVGEDAQRHIEASSKFWEIDAEGTQVTVRFGKIGTNGQTTVKTFDDSAAADAHAAKLIGEKTKKGYVEKTD
jgi:predicted DNA-binding WGR domain protein